MSSTIEVRGTISLGGDCISGCNGTAKGKHSTPITLSGCNGKQFQTVCECPGALVLATAGAVGDTFVDIGLLEDLTAIELLYIRSTARIQVRIGAAAATILGVAGAFPTGFGGGETLLVTLDGVPLVVTFTAAASLAQDVVNEINAAAALAGFLYLPATLDATAQVRISGLLTGSQGSVDVTGGTGAATIGFAGTPTAVGAGSDIDVDGTLLYEAPRSPNAPTRIQLSGNASVELLAAGRSAA